MNLNNLTNLTFAQFNQLEDEVTYHLAKRFKIFFKEQLVVVVGLEADSSPSVLDLNLVSRLGRIISPKLSVDGYYDVSIHDVGILMFKPSEIEPIIPDDNRHPVFETMDKETLEEFYELMSIQWMKKLSLPIFKVGDRVQVVHPHICPEGLNGTIVKAHYHDTKYSILFDKLIDIPEKFDAMFVRAL
jgi:hypothetical protein